MNIQQITITIQEYDELKNDSKFLAVLFEMGVDNWEWYGDALEKFENENKE